jgi:hypothetical protein
MRQKDFAKWLKPGFSSGQRPKKGCGVYLFGAVTYGLALLTWPLEAALLGAPFWAYLLVPVIPWFLCFGYVMFELRGSKTRLWMLPSALLGLHSVIVSAAMLIAWTIGGFV